MSDPRYNFQYCPKLILFSANYKSVLLAKRKGEDDYDGTFSFIGGKTETGDESLAAGLQREKNEEIGEAAKVRVYMASAQNVLFRKKDGNAMIIPHYLAEFVGGEIKLNHDEYSEYRWVLLDELDAFEPKIENIPEKVAWALTVKAYAEPKDFVEI